MHVVDCNPVLSLPCHLPSKWQVLGETRSPPEAPGPPPSPGLAAPSELALAHVSILCSWQVACTGKKQESLCESHSAINKTGTRHGAGGDTSQQNKQWDAVSGGAVLSILIWGDTKNCGGRTYHDTDQLTTFK